MITILCTVGGFALGVLVAELDKARRRRRNARALEAGWRAAQRRDLCLAEAARALRSKATPPELRS